VVVIKPVVDVIGGHTTTSMTPSTSGGWRDDYVQPPQRGSAVFGSAQRSPLTGEVPSQCLRDGGFHVLCGILIRS
jgi:hypothetical protein